MLLGRFIKELQKLEKKYGPRVCVSANAREMVDSCHGVFHIIEVKSAEYQLVNMADGDGGMIENKDGSERLQQTIVLGSYNPKSK